jgi:hypothetical protein
MVTSRLTSVYEKNFDSKICIANAHDENVIGIVKLQVIVPQVTHQCLDLFRESLLFKARYIRVGVLYQRSEINPY